MKNSFKWTNHKPPSHDRHQGGKLRKLGCVCIISADDGRVLFDANPLCPVHGNNRIPENTVHKGISDNLPEISDEAMELIRTKPNERYLLHHGKFLKPGWGMEFYMGALAMYRRLLVGKTEMSEGIPAEIQDFINAGSKKFFETYYGREKASIPNEFEEGAIALYRHNQETIAALQEKIKEIEAERDYAQEEMKELLKDKPKMRWVKLADEGFPTEAERYYVCKWCDSRIAPPGPLYYSGEESKTRWHAQVLSWLEETK